MRRRRELGEPTGYPGEGEGDEATGDGTGVYKPQPRGQILIGLSFSAYGVS